MTPAKSQEEKRARKRLKKVNFVTEVYRGFMKWQSDERMCVYAHNFLGYICNNWLDGWLLPEKNILWVV